ncbi:MAG TPA: type II toxin-antitoxin system PemK/MazF family toxin [Verrucomicrobiae bacterium]|nr:type II toxin-antitoxin system PemK/MazF family toxin [Verrucomicrobiae bacterium]
MPKRGEVWIGDLGFAQKVRPYTDEDRDLISVIPHLTAIRGITISFLKPGAFLVQHPITVSAAKAERFLGRLAPAQLALVEAGVRNWLGL